MFTKRIIPCLDVNNGRVVTVSYTHLPVNLVDTIDTYTITEKKFRLTVTEVPVKVVREGNTTVTQFRYDTKKTNEYLGKDVYKRQWDNRRNRKRILNEDIYAKEQQKL